MQGYFALATFVLLIVLVISRVLMLRRLGIRAFKFGEMDKRDFIIPPFVLFFLYVALAGAFGLPQLGAKLFASDAAAWAGVALCGLALALFLWFPRGHRRGAPGHACDVRGVRNQPKPHLYGFPIDTGRFFPDQPELDHTALPDWGHPADQQAGADGGEIAWKDIRGCIYAVL
jgi:hypothetical protein